MVVYFTGTGNSRYCAQMLAQQLNDQLTDAFPFIRDGSTAQLQSEKPWVFVAPTYGWQLPRIFTEFIRRGNFSGSRDAWFVMTCGGDIGNAASKIRRLCQETGFRYQGTLPVVMPENYIALFNAPEQAEALHTIAAARPFLELGSTRIQAGQPFPTQRVGLLDRLKSGPVNAAFYRFFIRATPFTVSETCVSCGKCEKDCPLNNIRLQDGHPIWGNRCTHCMACICGCPKLAIEYGKSSQGKPRYQCPDYQDSSPTHL